MLEKRQKYIVNTFIIAVSTMLLAIFNGYWAGTHKFPVYGYLIDIIAIGFVGFIMYKNSKSIKEITEFKPDEFEVLKIKERAQFSLISSIVLICTLQLATFLFPDLVKIIVSNSDSLSAFSGGITCSFWAINISILFGYLFIWIKYR